MFGFMLKKWFFNYWDNFFTFVILNMFFVFSVALAFGIPGWIASFSPVLSLIVMIGGILWLGAYTAAASLYINEIAQERSVEPKQFFRFLKESWLLGIFYSIFWALIIFTFSFIVPFYGNMGNLWSVAALAFLFWTLVIFILAVQWFFPIRAQLDRKLSKILKKMFILFFDNAGFSIFLLITSLSIFIVSGFTAFLLFGPGGFLLMQHVALKLRLYKYDYFEEHPDAKRKHVPWKALVYEDSQRIGKRTLKGMIFPWKE
ncbi:hypothetical protein [Salinispira pacifica]|uniref:Uncharacterized protein n=1 Tax=Salinispira pacifica TaxID=1307761 RepID=V5WIB0_9SPIO|nr:hypothetical protein [Salinispira pacifica]AHC15304.1 hypothetical protein L21SP2_1933 [Salinispira pacifica]